MKCNNRFLSDFIDSIISSHGLSSARVLVFAGSQPETYSEGGAPLVTFDVAVHRTALSLEASATSEVSASGWASWAAIVGSSGTLLVSVGESEYESDVVLDTTRLVQGLVSSMRLSKQFDVR